MIQTLVNELQKRYPANKPFGMSTRRYDAGRDKIKKLNTLRGEFTDQTKNLDQCLSEIEEICDTRTDGKLNVLSSTRSRKKLNEMLASITTNQHSLATEAALRLIRNKVLVDFGKRCRPNVFMSRQEKEGIIKKVRAIKESSSLDNLGKACKKTRRSSSSSDAKSFRLFIRLKKTYRLSDPLPPCSGSSPGEG